MADVLRDICMLSTAYPITLVTFNFAPTVPGSILLLVGAVWCLTACFWFAGRTTDVENLDVVIRSTGSQTHQGVAIHGHHCKRMMMHQNGNISVDSMIT